MALSKCLCQKKSDCIVRLRTMGVRQLWWARKGVKTDNLEEWVDVDGVKVEWGWGWWLEVFNEIMCINLDVVGTWGRESVVDWCEWKKFIEYMCMKSWRGGERSG